jgi:hypothetical protein
MNATTATAAAATPPNPAVNCDAAPVKVAGETPVDVPVKVAGETPVDALVGATPLLPQPDEAGAAADEPEPEPDSEPEPEPQLDAPVVAAGGAGTRPTAGTVPVASPVTKVT